MFYNRRCSIIQRVYKTTGKPLYTQNAAFGEEDTNKYFDLGTLSQTRRINATKKGSSVIKETLSALGNIKQFDESHISSSDDNKYACEIRVVSPPQGKDPDEFIRTSGGEAFVEYIKNAPLLIDFLLNNTLKNKNEAKTPGVADTLSSEIFASPSSAARNPP